MNARMLLLGLLALLVLGIVPTPKPSASPAPLSLLVDGVRVPVEPPPLLHAGRVYVPLQRTLDALGIPFQIRGGVVSAQFGAHNFVLRLGSAQAILDGTSVDLGAPPFKRLYTLYVPLHFVGVVLGAQASYDARARSVSISGSSIGQNGSGFVLASNGLGVRIGDVSEVDTISEPRTITVLYDGTAHTVALRDDLRVQLHDVNTNVVRTGRLSDVLPGDFVRVEIGKHGNGSILHDDFGVRSGLVAAVAAGEFILTDGRVIVPDRTTRILLNGAVATLAQARVGDNATIRYNVESDEIQQVILSDTTGVLAASGGIRSISVSPTTPLRAGDILRVRMHGTPGGLASFDIGGIVHDVGMREERAGVYGGSLRIGGATSIARSPVVVTLLVGATRSVARASTEVSASSVSPGIGRIGPGSGSVVSSRKPAIYATFLPDAVGIDARSAMLFVNGHDVTSETIRSARFIHFIPEVNYSGLVRVTVRVSDLAGNVATRSWSFTVRR